MADDGLYYAQMYDQVPRWREQERRNRSDAMDDIVAEVQWQRIQRALRRLDVFQLEHDHQFGTSGEPADFIEVSDGKKITCSTCGETAVLEYTIADIKAGASWPD